MHKVCLIKKQDFNKWKLMELRKWTTLQMVLVVG